MLIVHVLGVLLTLVLVARVFLTFGTLWNIPVTEKKNHTFSREEPKCKSCKHGKEDEENITVHTNVRDVRDVMSGMYGVVVRCTQYLCWL